MTRKGRRLAIISAAGFTLAIAVGLILFALRDSIVFFYGPTEMTEKAPPRGTHLRIGGLVKRCAQSDLRLEVEALVLEERPH